MKVNIVTRIIMLRRAYWKLVTRDVVREIKETKKEGTTEKQDNTVALQRVNKSTSGFGKEIDGLDRLLKDDGRAFLAADLAKGLASAWRDHECSRKDRRHNAGIDAFIPGKVLIMIPALDRFFFLDRFDSRCVHW